MVCAGLSVGFGAGTQIQQGVLGGVGWVGLCWDELRARKYSKVCI